MPARVPPRRRLALTTALALLAFAGAETAEAQGLLGRIDRGPTAAEPEAAEPAPPADPYGDQDDTLYETIRGSSDRESYRRFVTLFPESPFVAEAEAALARLDAEANERAGLLCDGRWPALEESCDPGELEGFVAACPESPFVRRAKLRLKGIRIGMHCKGVTVADAPAPAAEVEEATTAPPAAASALEAETPAAPVAEAPEATDLGIAVTPASGTVYARSASNVRVGPGTEFERRGTIPAGTRITLTGEAANGWKRFEYQGAPAFIAGQLVQTAPVASQAARRPASATSAGPDGGDPSPYQYRRPAQADAPPPERSSGSGFSFRNFLEGSSDFQPFGVERD